jgi:site-specific DNA-methyltransferase (adenine-specific)
VRVPYYSDESVSIYLGNCLEILPELPVSDLLLTDPPYGIGLKMVMNHGTNKNRIHDAADWNNRIPSPAIFDLIHERSRNQIIWGCNYFGSNIKSVGRIVHDKQLEIADTKLKWSEADIASCSMQNRVTIFRYRWNGNVQGSSINWNNTGEDARRHPTQKPLSLMRHCVATYSKPGDVILDPFMGSGTTLRAAKDLGRKAIGVEIEEKYCEIAAKRMAQEVLAFS